jgi:hypothetical protein
MLSQSVLNLHVNNCYILYIFRYIFALPQRDDEGRRVIFTVASKYINVHPVLSHCLYIGMYQFQKQNYISFWTVTKVRPNYVSLFQFKCGKFPIWNWFACLIYFLTFVIQEFHWSSGCNLEAAWSSRRQSLINLKKIGALIYYFTS